MNDQSSNAIYTMSCQNLELACHMARALRRHVHVRKVHLCAVGTYMYITHAPPWPSAPSLRNAGARATTHVLRPEVRVFRASPPIAVVGASGYPASRPVVSHEPR
jgi:hypothetical protein